MKVKIKQNYRIRIITYLIKIFKISFTLFKVLYFTDTSTPLNRVFFLLLNFKVMSDRITLLFEKITEY